MERRRQELRERYLSFRNNLSAAERSGKSFRIWERLKNEPVFEKAQILLTYMDYRSEVMTTGLIEELFDMKTKRVFAPRVEGMDIRFYEVFSMEDFENGYQGIREPRRKPDRQLTRELTRQSHGLILVPGAVFDRERGRLGYGKGFYDRYLAAFPWIYSAALAFDCQIAKKVPTGERDIRPEIIITESEVIR